MSQKYKYLDLTGLETFVNRLTNTYNIQKKQPSNEFWYKTTDGIQLSLEGSSESVIKYHVYDESIGYWKLALNNGANSFGRIFDSKTTLQDILIPGDVTSIPGYAFFGCSSLTSVTIGNSVTEIGECAFNGCTSLNNITIPYSVESIGSYTIYGFTTNVYFEGDVLPTISNLDTNATIFVKPGTDLTNLPTTHVAKYYIPSDNNVVSGTNIKTINGESILGDSNISVQRTQANDEFWYRTTNGNPLVLNNVASNVYDESIGYYVAVFNDMSNWSFAFQSSLKEIIIPNNVTEIGQQAFVGCTLLEKIVIGNNVQIIGQDALYSVSSNVFFRGNSFPVIEGDFDTSEVIFYVKPGTDLTNAATITKPIKYYIPSTDDITSGTNIKTINGESLLGEGDMTILKSDDFKTIDGKSILEEDITLTTINGQSLTSGGNIEIVSTESLSEYNRIVPINEGVGFYSYYLNTYGVNYVDIYNDVSQEYGDMYAADTFIPPLIETKTENEVTTTYSKDCKILFRPHNNVSMLFNTKSDPSDPNSPSYDIIWANGEPTFVDNTDQNQPHLYEISFRGYKDSDNSIKYLAVYTKYEDA